jgi:hypothetical protein
VKTIDIETWRVVIDHWRSQGKDLRHLEVPPELAAQLGVPMDMAVERRREQEIETEDSEDHMVKKNTKVKQGTKNKKAPPPPKKKSKKAPLPKPKTASAEPVPVATTNKEGFEMLDRLALHAQISEAPAVGQGEIDEHGGALGTAKWKKRREFEGDMCGYAGCTKKSDGYVSGVRSTKEGERDRRSMWYGPACVSCVRKWHPNLNPVTLAALAQQRNGSSDLAAVLDIEVGEVHKRLTAAGIDERGQSLMINQPKTQFQDNSMTQRTPSTALAPSDTTEQHNISVAVPYSVIGAIRSEMAATAQALSDFVIRTQEQMDYASKYMQRVKGLLKDVEDKRKDIARPFRDVINNIQAHFNPVKIDLQNVEEMIKARIDEAYRWSQQQKAQSFVEAQGALAAGDHQGVAVATQGAMAADLSLAKGISMRPKVCFEVVDPSQLPGIYWSPDPAKVQAYLDTLDLNQLQPALAAGYVIISGVRVWVENTVAARAA